MQNQLFSVPNEMHLDHLFQLSLMPMQEDLLYRNLERHIMMAIFHTLLGSPQQILRLHHLLNPLTTVMYFLHPLLLRQQLEGYLGQMKMQDQQQVDQYLIVQIAS